jgi:hypothetical protein
VDELAGPQTPTVIGSGSLRSRCPPDIDRSLRRRRAPRAPRRHRARPLRAGGRQDFTIPTHGVVNIHPGLLPWIRSVSPFGNALLLALLDGPSTVPEVPMRSYRSRVHVRRLWLPLPLLCLLLNPLRAQQAARGESGLRARMTEFLNAIQMIAHRTGPDGSFRPRVNGPIPKRFT